MTSDLPMGPAVVGTIHSPGALREALSLQKGEVDLLEGNGVGGVAVEVGRWIRERAGPGEVLVSHTVRDLVAGSGLSFEERGEATFDSAPSAWRLYKVRAGSCDSPQV